MKSACLGSGDDLSLYAYGFLEGAECAAVEEHLRICPRCREIARNLQRERDLVAFELSLDAGVGPMPVDSDPVRESAPPRRRPRVLPLVAAAALLLVVTVTAWFVSRPEPVAESGWRDLPDGSRYRIVDTAAVSLPREMRRLEMDSGSLLLDVCSGGEEFRIETPYATVHCDEGRLAVSVEPSGTIVEVLEGQVRVEPVEGGVETVVPGESGNVHVVFVEMDPNPDLLARIEELEERLRELGEVIAEPPEPETGADAIAKHDWGALAGSYAEVGAALREGRLPQDPVALRRYLRVVEDVHRLAKAVGIEPTMEAVARDPRTGPRLFAANLERLWPEAPGVDIDMAEAVAARALTEFADAVAVAPTPAAEVAAEERLREDLAREVERFEETHGPAVETRVEIPVLIPGPIVPRSPEPVEAPTGDVVPTPKGGEEQSAVQQVLEATGLGAGTDRVHSGTVDEIARAVVADWRRDFGYGNADETTLDSLARTWVRDYEDTLAREDGDVVAAFEADLGRGLAPADVQRSRVAGLRAELLRLQGVIEARLPPPTTAVSSVATFFLIDRPRSAIRR